MLSSPILSNFEIDELVRQGGKRWQNYGLDRIYLRHHFVEGYIEQYDEFLQDCIMRDMNKAYINVESGEVRLPNAAAFPELTESVIQDAIKDARKRGIRNEIVADIERESEIPLYTKEDMEEILEQEAQEQFLEFMRSL